MKQTIIIAWGAGFIGSNFLNLFVPQYPEINFVNTDALTYAGDTKNISPEVENAQNYFFERVDIRDMEALRKIYSSYHPTDIIHFAAETHVCTSIENPRLFTETNVWGTQNLLELHREFWLQRFHYVSTDEVYGDAGEETIFTEQSPLKPSNPYSASKAAADMLVMSYGRTFGIDYTLTRCSNNYGPNQQSEKLIPLCISKIQKNEQIPLHGNGTYIRDWIYVTDHCHAVWRVFQEAKTTSLYNVGASTEKTNLEITHTILDRMQAPKELISFVPNRPGYDARYAMNTKKIQKELWWLPQVSFEEGIQLTLDSYNKQ
jgi:dTDP-glucose 4,6-dehydratase